MTYQRNPLLIIFPYLPDECGDNSCSCYCIPHRDADSIYSRMRIVTLEPSFHCSTCQPKEKLSIWRSIPSLCPEIIYKNTETDCAWHSWTTILPKESYLRKKMIFTWRFWRLTLWLIISYSLWNDEIKLCILSPCLMLYFKHFLLLLTQRVSFQ